MPLIASALVPLALLIAMGMVLQRTRFLPATFWSGLDRINYWIWFPSLIFHALATSDAQLAGAGRVAATIWASLTIVAALTLVARTVLAHDGPAFTSAFQGAIRFNSYVAFLVVPALFPGSEATTALLVACTVPLVNVFCVGVLARFAGATRPTVRSVALALAGNPLIVASVGGVIVHQLGVPLGPVGTVLETLGRASLAAGLLSVGVTLTFRSVRASLREIVGSTVLKFTALPAVAAVVGTLLGVDASTLALIVTFQALPTASSAYVLARAMGGDHERMAAILAMQTVAALVWLPIAFQVATLVTGTMSPP